MSENRPDINRQSKEEISGKVLLGQTVTINDLRDREFNGDSLSPQEAEALANFDKFRLEELNRQENDKDFHNKYIQLQVMANLSPWAEFLKEKYI